MAAEQAFTTRRMARGELDWALDMAAAEGWNPGLADADCFWAADPAGFHLGLLDGRPAACVSAVSYGPGYGFVGLYIVAPELRGQGLGMRLWREAVDPMPQRCVGLDAVVAQQDNYAKDGFVLAYASHRYVTTSRGPDPMAVPPGVLPLAAFPPAEALALDRRAFPAERAEFLRAWVAAPGHVALGLAEGGRLAGFGVLRPCRAGCKIGPLFAEGEAGAHALFHGLLACAPAGPVFLDVPAPNAAATRLASAHGMEPMFETGRMYRGPAPEVDLLRVFGVTTFELG
jgi:GNAT superfamily N-acetyltransferase